MDSCSGGCTLYPLSDGKFEHKYQEIVVHGEDEQSIYRDPSVPCLEARKGSEHIVYQAFEIVVADQYEEGNHCPQPFLSNASIMMAKEMIRHGFKPGKGLGKSLQGITEPVTLTASEKFFGIVFRPTPTDVKWANDRKNDGWVLPQPVPHLYRTFVKPKYHGEEEYEVFTAEEIEEICGAMRKILYEAHMVQPGEGSSTAEVLSEEIRETKISIFTDGKTREALIQLLFEFKDVFAWSYDNMIGLIVDLVVHKLPTYPDCPPVQQKQRKFKTDISNKIKEEVTKQLKAGVIRVVRHTTWLDPLKYIFQKPMPTGRLAKWQILLTKFDIVYVTRTAMKAQALADHLAENPVDDEYQPLNTYISDEEVNSVEAISEDINAWKMFFDGAVNAKGVGTGAILISPIVPWPFVAWGMDVIGSIEPKASNGHRFILVAIDYFTKWVETITLKSVTKKAVVDFVHSNLICRFGIPATIITDNAANLNSHLMGEICEQFKITHRNSTPYRPKANGTVEAANKNIKKILRKMIQSFRQWHEKLPFALLGYRTTMRTSIGATPYLLLYGTEAVIPMKVEIPFLRIIDEAEIEDSE
ncbi:uncharacterized protein [Nicotiana sylvestris]|uniref:uncharacterized protein n=1 Tax=Nicotiana sylvestris TaxID=4096 RepID=UPI00388CEAF7